MKILVIASDGSEDSELVTTTSILKRAGIECHILSCTDNLVITGSHGSRIVSDNLYSKETTQGLLDYSGIFFPGGKKACASIRDNKDVLNLVRMYNDRAKPLFAICAGPTILGESGIMMGKRFTCYDGFENYIKDGIYVAKAPVVQDGYIITGRSAGYTMEFALQIVRYLLGEEKENQIKKALLLEV